MSEEFVAAPPDDPIWETSSSVGLLKENEKPSKEITAAIEERRSTGPFDFYRGDIWGFQGYTDWPTSS